MDFHLLGPLEILVDHVPVPIAAGKQRALLAILLLNANRTVSRDQLVDALWGEEVPDTAQKMVQIQVSKLRKVLPEPRLHTRRPGYALEVREDELDVARFERAVADGSRALAEGDAEGSDGLLNEALGLWRGPALAEFSEPFALPEGARLEELRLAAVELRIEAELVLGRERDVIGELETLIAQHPLRERPRSQHMLALYRSGRQAEALASYQAFRRTLSEELGIEPSASPARATAADAPTGPVPRAAASARRSRRSTRPAMSRTREVATSGSPTRSSATGRSTSCSSTAGSAPSSPAGSIRSSRRSTGGSRRWGV